MHRCSVHYTTIFVNITKVSTSTTCFGHFWFGHHQFGSNLMMAKSEMAETCSWCGYLSYTYRYSCVMTATYVYNLLLYVLYTQRGWRALKFKFLTLFSKYRMRINYQGISLRHNLNRKCRKIVKFVSINTVNVYIWNGTIVATAISREKRKPVLEGNGCHTDRA